MRKTLVTLAAAPILVIGLSSCNTNVSTSIPTAFPTVGGDSAAAAEVEAYCKKVDQVVAKADQLRSNPNAQLSQEVSQQAQELVKQAAGLVGDVVTDPALAARVSQCSADAASAAGGG